MKQHKSGASKGAPTHRIGGIGSDRLTDRACKAAHASRHVGKLSDGKGMYLLDGLYRRLKYRHGGKERQYAMGAYPEISLSDARAERDRARAWLRDGKDPVSQRRLERAGEVAKRATTFEAVAREFIRAQEWSAAHPVAVVHRLENELLPDLGRLPVESMTAPMVLAAGDP